MIPEVEFATAAVVTVNAAALERLRRAATESPRRRARLCLHSSTSESLHEMIIVLRQGTSIAVHRHPFKAECYHVISGKMSILICDAAGQMVQRIPLGVCGSDRDFVCRIAADLWHTVEVESEEVVVHESTAGPFSPGDTEYQSVLAAEFPSGDQGV